MNAPKILITPGEPAGIGPELVVRAALQPQQAQLIACCDPTLLELTAKQLGCKLHIKDWHDQQQVLMPGSIWCLPQALQSNVVPGQLNPANSSYVVSTLATAADLALQQRVDAIFTGPVHKGIINQAGIQFFGHTEFFQNKAQSPQVVMMLATTAMRVALVTTHLPLKDVPAAITHNKLLSVLTILIDELKQKFAIERPTIAVLGLNPHAGEQGHMGREEIEVIEPALAKIVDAEIMGPLPADTAFQPKILDKVDAVLAMYHDQGLPVLKYSGFGNAVNITLGLPFLRTSVDHGTALDIAGQGIADVGSFNFALDYTLNLLQARRH